MPALAVLVVVLFAVFEHTQLTQVGRKFFAALTYSALIGIPCSFVLNWIGYRFAPRFPRLVVLMNTAALLALATVGTFAGGLAFQIAGLVQRRDYWVEFRGSYPITILVSLIFGLSISSFETMRHKLQIATLDLRTQQVEQERANKLLAEARLSSLESRIHPHFLFNTLNSIAALIPSDPKRAEDTVGKLASLLRFSLNANHSSLVPLSQEMKVVRDYLEIESTRFGPRLRYQIAVPESLGSVKVPPLALAVSGGEQREACGGAAQRRRQRSQVAASTADGRVHLEVVDDGPGFSLASISPEHGLGNLSARLQLLFGDAGQLDVARENGKTVARISFPAEV